MAHKKRWSMLWRMAVHLLEINWNVFRGMWQLTRLPQPAITVFGGSRLPKEHKYSQTAFDLSRRLAEDGFSIITGGGPGIMEAANLGAFEYAKDCGNKDCDHKKCKKKRVCNKKDCDHKRCRRKLVSMGIGVSGLHIEKLNPYVHDQIIMDHFFTRKWLLVRYSVGFVVFPGGFGTLDELFEIITLTQTSFMEKTPIVLIGSNYWSPLIKWIDDHVIAMGLAHADDRKLITIVDTADEAFQVIDTLCKECLER